MLIPPNKNDFYATTQAGAIFQGDILDANTIGLKEKEDIYSPDYWMVITKSCDLAWNDDCTQTRKGNISVIPVLRLKILDLITNRNFLKQIQKLNTKIVLMAIVNIFSKLKINKENVNNLIKDKISKFMYLPPDGIIFNQPMIIDFDLVHQLDGSDAEIVKKALCAKKLQLASPFREKVAQRFAKHYSDIGVNDEHLRSDNYIKAVTDSIKK